MANRAGEKRVAGPGSRAARWESGRKRSFARVIFAKFVKMENRMELVAARDWERWQSDYGLLPYVLRVDRVPFPDGWMAWWGRSEASFLLETGKAGRHTMLSLDPETIYEGREEGLRVLGRDGTVRCEAGNSLELLRGKLREFRTPRVSSAPPFQGGLMGYVSYDLIRLWEKIPVVASSDLNWPLFTFGACMECWVYDHLEGCLYCCLHVPRKETGPSLVRAHANCRERAMAMADQWLDRALKGAAGEDSAVQADPRLDAAVNGGLEATFTRESYAAAVRRVHEFIAAGHTYQVNLSLRQSRSLRASPEMVYERLRRINPSPHMALLRFPDHALVSGSPELLVRLRGRRLETRPIAGTRPRGSDEGTDVLLSGEMLASAKERAEHLMLVDLLRNDLGRVSSFGSVRVTEFMTVERYSHVMHIVSHIEAELAKGRDAFDVLASVFPGGTITGAPKIRTMEIIEMLEPVRRGPYTGSIGWIGFHGDMELSITIRTLLVLRGVGHVQVGAGIVADSDPEREYEESLSKGRALWAAVAAAEAGMVLSEAAK